MEKKHPDVIMTEMVDKCLNTLVNKAKEYSMDSDRLHNFRVAAALQDCRMRRSLYGMMVKHITSIADMCCSDEEYSQELWEEKIQDNINYLLLLRAVVQEEIDAVQIIEENDIEQSNIDDYINDILNQCCCGDCSCENEDDEGYTIEEEDLLTLDFSIAEMASYTKEEQEELITNVNDLLKSFFKTENQEN